MVQLAVDPPPTRWLRALLLTWSALWRAQVSHLVVFAVVPLLAAILHAALGVILLPFLPDSFGDGLVARGAQAAHLRQPSCWLMLAPCGVADRTVAPVPFMASSSDQPPATRSGVTVEPFLPAPTALTVRHVWFVLWLAWFGAYLVHRERSGRSTAHASGTAPP